MAKNDKISVVLDIQGEAAVKELDLLQSKSNKLTAELKGMKKGSEEYANTYQQLNQVNQSLANHQNQIGLSGMTIAQLTNLKNKLYQEIRKNLIPGTEEYIKKTQELSKVTDRLQEINGKVAQVDSVWSKFKKSFVISIDVISLIDRATSSFTAMSKEIEEVTRRTIDLRNNIESLMGLQGLQLDETTAKVQALSDKFGKDYKEVLLATNNLAQQYGITQSQALDLVEKGFVKGADASGDFLDKIKEYGVQFKNAGFSAEQFIKMAVQEVKGGIFSDKLLDTTKELGNRLRELGKSQQDALTNAFGQKFSDDFVKRMKTTSMTVVQGFELIRSEMGKVNLSTSQMQTLIADLSGGAGEDLGGLSVYFKEFDKSMNINLDTLTDLEKAQLKQLNAQKQLSTANVELAKEFAPYIKKIDEAGTAIKITFVQSITAAIRGISDFVGFISQNRAALIPLLVALTAYNAQLLVTRTASLAAAVAIGVKRVAMGLLNLVMAANPIGFIITLIAGLSSAFIYAYQNLEGFRAVIMGVWNVMSNLGTIIKAVIADITTFNFAMSNSGKAIGKAFNDGYNGELKKGADERKKQKEEEDKAKIKKYEENLAKEREIQRKDEEQDKAKRQQADQEQLEKAKEAHAKMLEALKKYREAKYKIEQSIIDLKNAQIKDEYKREEAIAQSEYQRKLKESRAEFAEILKLNVAHGAELANLKRLQNQKEVELENELQAKKDQIRLKQLEDQDRKNKEEADRTQKKFQDYLKVEEEFASQKELQQDEIYLRKQEKIAEQYGYEDEGNALRLEALLQAENERQMALFDINAAFLNQKLVDLELMGLKETAEYQKTKNAIIQNELEKGQKIADNEKRIADLKKQLRESEAGLFQDFINLTGEFLSQDEEQRRKYAGILKVLTIANIGIGLQREIQGIWENANKNPINAILPGYGTAYAGIQTGFAIARGALAINKVNTQKFADGGILRGDGVVNGSSHWEGGLAVFDNRTGRQVAEIEGREGLVFSQKAIRNNPKTWGALMYSSKNNGARVDTYEDGGGINMQVAQSERGVAGTQLDQNQVLLNKLDTLVNVIEANANSFKVIKAYVDIFELEQKMLQNQQTRQNNSSL